MDTFEFDVNGEGKTVQGAGDDPLIFALRNQLHLASPRLGCGQEQCGACRVLVDGNIDYACSLQLSTVQGGHITTLEGLEHNPLMRRLQAAFAARNAAQCGYCLTGVLLAAWHLLSIREVASDAQVHAPLSRATIASTLDGQLCRCGSHARMLDAICEVADT